ncbi:unnamed protein product [Lactuca saligna]|uniref:Myb-like domain-containing protein n=1 Tax=Lactuca saligna TaxID=75948 RepID=A0AA36A171_LACSI|nr:unnamed protein product [Lactuca saligna]
MDHGRYGQPAFTTGHTRVHFNSRIPSLDSEVPFYMRQVLNPDALPPHTFRDNPTVTPPPPPPAYSPQTGWNGFNSGINLNHGTTSYAQSTTIRWPRQETLALLEIRSRLDPCFKEATSSNHKAPLWDEISRIMNEDYGYQRSGRKCKEKFENLYKYYKKTKEGKVGKHDGKHYRFFRQLESLFGDQHDHRSINSNIVIHPSSQSNNSSEHGTPSSEKNRSNRKLKKKEMIAVIEESMESQFSKLMAKQDEFGKKILCTIERKEHEREVSDEEWRKQEVARLDHECESWASHVARIETRDECLLNALQNLLRVRSIGSTYRSMVPMENSEEINGCLGNYEKHKDWIETEICSLIRIRTEKECRFQDVNQEHGEGLWQEVAFELSLLGYSRSDSECKEIWEKICVDFNKTKLECESMKKEDSSRKSNSMDDKGDRNSCFSATAMNIDGERSWETM